VLFGGGTDVYLRFAEQGLLEPVDLPPPLRERIPPQLNGVPLYDPKGRWYGPVLSSFGILCNRTVLDRIGEPEPRQWADLGRPGLAGWVSAGDPRMAGSVHMVYEIVLQSAGWDAGVRLLLRLGANTHSFIRDSGTLTRTVSNGEVAAAGNLDANALTAVGRNPDAIAFHLPDGQTIINPDAMAVLRGAPEMDLAKGFVE
jgi:ABC-type Fe3+ transport system substrate-binding protein